MSFVNSISNRPRERAVKRFRSPPAEVTGSIACERLEPRQLLASYSYIVPAGVKTAYLQKTDTPGQVQVRLDSPTGPIDHTFTNTSGRNEIVAHSNFDLLVVDQVPAAFKPRMDQQGDNGIYVRGGSRQELRLEASDADTLIQLPGYTSLGLVLEVTDSSGNVGRTYLHPTLVNFSIRTNDDVADDYYPNGGTDVIVQGLSGLYSVAVDTGAATYSRVTLNHAYRPVVKTGAGHNIVTVQRWTAAEVDFGAGTGTGQGLGRGHVLNVHGLQALGKIVSLDGGGTIAVDAVNAFDGGDVFVEAEAVIGNIDVAPGSKAVIFARATIESCDVDGTATFSTGHAARTIIGTFGRSDGTVEILTSDVTVERPSYIRTVILDGFSFPVSGAFLEFQTSGSHVSTLTVFDGRVTLRERAASPVSSTPRVLTVNTLNLHQQTPTSPTGDVDLKDNILIIDYSGPSPASDVQALVTSGYADGTWLGAGLHSTTAAAVASTGIGYAEASEIFSDFPATFAGHRVDATSVLLRYTHYGDADLDGRVDLDDFDRLAANFGQTGRRWIHGDSNFDGAVDRSDFARLIANFGQPSLAGGKDEDGNVLADVSARLG